MFHIFIVIFAIISSFIFGISTIDFSQNNNLSNPIKQIKESIKKDNVNKSRQIPQEKQPEQFKSDGTPLKSILREKNINSIDKITSNKTVSFNEIRTTKIGNRIKLEKTFNRITSSR